MGFGAHGPNGSRAKPRLASPSARNHALDGLRGTAALLVVLYHCAAVLYPAILTGDPAIAHGGWDVALNASPFWVLLNGEFDVAVFFALSGYVLTRDAFVTGDMGRLRHRAVGRLVRLALPAGASTLGVFLLLHAGAYQIQAAQALSGADAVFDSRALFTFPWDFRSLLDNLAWRTWFAPVDVTRMYNLVLWTMPVELWGSWAVCVAGLVLGGARLRTALLVAIACVAWQAVPGSGVGLGTLIGGSALASWRVTLPPPLALALAAFGITLASYHGAHTLSLPRGLDAPLHGLAALLLVAGVVHAPLLQVAFAHRVPVALGRISVALYLVHQPILYSLGAAVFVRLAPSGYAAAAAVSVLAVLATSLPLAILATRFVDQPATRLARAVASRFLR